MFGAGGVRVGAHLLVAVHVEPVRGREVRVRSPTRIENRFEPPPFGAAVPSIFLPVCTWRKYVPCTGMRRCRSAPTGGRTTRRCGPGWCRGSCVDCCSSVFNCGGVDRAVGLAVRRLRVDAGELGLAHDRVVGRVPRRDVGARSVHVGPRVGGVAAVAVVVVAVAERAGGRRGVAHRRCDRRRCNPGICAAVSVAASLRLLFAFASLSPQLSPTWTNAGS